MPDKILVVDDEPDQTRLLTRHLIRSGYEVCSANSGERALEVSREHSPDLIVLDVSMPGLSGLEVCRTLRQDIRSQTIPIIFLTARVDIHDCLEGFAAGGDDYVSKPCDIHELSARVKCMLSRRRRDMACNPLTQLPGSPSIEEEVHRRLRLKEPFAFAYLDIDHFKSFNDAYGYDAGDQLIKDFGKMLMACSLGAPQADVYPGHIGGDDFVLIASIPGMQYILPILAQTFDAKRPYYYPPHDRERGYICLRNRQGVLQNFPLLTLTISVVSTQTRIIPRYTRLVEIASELKTYLKGVDHRGQSLTQWDRRTDFSPFPRPAGA